MAIPQEDYSPRYVGDLSKPLSHTFTDHSNKPMPLIGVVGANMTLRMRNQTTGLTTTGAGTWLITDAANGVASYIWVAADVAMAGEFDIQVSVPFPDGLQHFDIRPIAFITPL